MGFDGILHYLRKTFDLNLFYDYNAVTLTIKSKRFADFTYANDNFDCRSIYSMTMILD